MFLDQDILVKEYDGLVKSLVNKHIRKSEDFDDLYQEGMLGLLEANRRFDPEKGAAFATYAYFWVAKWILRAKMGDREYNHESIDANGYDAIADQHVQDNEEPQQSLRLPEDLPELEREILMLSYSERMSIKEIADRLGISPERVRQLRGKALRRVRAKLPAALTLPRQHGV